MKRYEIGCMLMQRGFQDTGHVENIDTDDLAAIIQRLAHIHRWAVLAVKAYNEGFEYYKYTGEKVFYYPKAKRWITDKEYETMYKGK